MLNGYVVSATICFAFPILVSSRSCGESDSQGNRRPFRANADNPPANKLPPEPQPPQKPRSRCCPYDFDGSLCKVIDDRVLCGYNRNVGRPYGNNNEVHLGQDCRLRGGRLECGYFQGPFTNPRRPPPSYNPGPDTDDESNKKYNNIIPQTKTSSEEMGILDGRNKKKLTLAVSTQQPKGVTRSIDGSTSPATPC